MKDIFKINILLDFYKELLTEHQVKTMELYSNNDYTLSEIAEIMGSSRQAVYDNIKRSMKQLEEYELKLRLYENYLINKSKLEMITKELDSKQYAHVISLIKEIIER